MDETTGACVPDALHDLRFVLAWWADAAGGNDAGLVAAKAAGKLGTFSIDVAAMDRSVTLSTSCAAMDPVPPPPAGVRSAPNVANRSWKRG